MDRISKLQSSHPWLTDEQARLLLIIQYYESSRVKEESPKATQHSMDAWTMSLVENDTEEIKVFLRNLG